MKNEELINNVREYLLKYEGIDLSNEELSSDEKLLEFILPALKTSKDSLSSLYDYSPKNRFGIIGKIKTKIELKVVNIVKATLERQALKQQKFNDMAYQAIVLLIEERANKK